MRGLYNRSVQRYFKESGRYKESHALKYLFFDTFPCGEDISYFEKSGNINVLVSYWQFSILLTLIYKKCFSLNEP